MVPRSSVSGAAPASTIAAALIELAKQNLGGPLPIQEILEEYRVPDFLALATLNHHASHGRNSSLIVSKDPFYSLYINPLQRVWTMAHVSGCTPLPKRLSKSAGHQTTALCLLHGCHLLLVQEVVIKLVFEATLTGSSLGPR